MDIAKAYTFITDEDGWITKIAIGAVWLLLSVFILPYFFLVGYQLAVIRNVMRGEEHPLPEWSNLGQMFMDGLYVVIAGFVYSLPIWILFCLGSFIFILPAFGAGNDDVAALLAGISFVGWSVMACIGLLLGLALAFIWPAISIQYVRTNEFGALFRFGEVIAIARENIVDIFLTILAGIGANIVVQLLIGVLAITICGGIIVGLAGPVWILFATGHLYGQIAAKMSGKQAEAGYAV